MLQWRTSHNCVSKTLHTHYFLENSHALINGRKHAKDLLECAKRAVEIAIEQNEQRLLLSGWNLFHRCQMLSVCIFNHQTMLKRVQQRVERI